MTDRTYRTLVGVALLIGLFFDSPMIVYALIVMMFIEGITNFRLPKAVCYVRNCVGKDSDSIEYVAEGNPDFKYNTEAERVWRFVVGSLLLVTFHFFYEQLWFFPWFMGFAIFGAGLSGVCPVLLAIRWVGFR